MLSVTSEGGRKTNPLIWLAAIICSIIAIVVIIAGVVIFVIYIVYRPSLPYFRVPYANLNTFDYDQFGNLETEMSLTVLAKNDNKVYASFSNISIVINFHGINVAELRAAPFNLPKNSSLELNYVVPSRYLPLGGDKGAMGAVNVALKKGIIPFDINGHARTQWRIGIFRSVKFWSHLSCEIQFFWPNGSVATSDCRSK